MPRSDTKLGDERAVAAPVAIIRYDGSEAATGDRVVPVEVPVGVVYADSPFAVMMMTPDDLEDFAVGFTVTEGVAERPEDIRGVRIETDEAALRLHVDLVPARLHAHLARRRAMSGRTGCGVCGIDDFDALPRARVTVKASGRVSAGAIRHALDELANRQALNRLTRAVHAAAWAAPDGRILALREDVGRHNALDKLVGALLRGGTRPEAGFIVVTSRCSFEMVEKAAAFGAGTMVAISAPTSLALDRAELHDMTLVALARHDSLMVFHGAERIIPADVYA